MLSTEFGYQLWAGNNPYTFSHYPSESIDRSRNAALDALGPQEKAETDTFGEAALDHWFQRRAITYIYEHPFLTVTNAFRKIDASFW